MKNKKIKYLLLSFIVLLFTNISYAEKNTVDLGETEVKLLDKSDYEYFINSLSTTEKRMWNEKFAHKNILEYSSGIEYKSNDKITVMSNEKKALDTVVTFRYLLIGVTLISVSGIVIAAIIGPDVSEAGIFSFFILITIVPMLFFSNNSYMKKIETADYITFKNSIISSEITEDKSESSKISTHTSNNCLENNNYDDKIDNDIAEITKSTEKLNYEQLLTKSNNNNWASVLILLSSGEIKVWNPNEITLYEITKEYGEKEIRKAEFIGL